jgi:hypothetical protein
LTIQTCRVCAVPKAAEGGCSTLSPRAACELFGREDDFRGDERMFQIAWGRRKVGQQSPEIFREVSRHCRGDLSLAAVRAGPGRNREHSHANALDDLLNVGSTVGHFLAAMLATLGHDRDILGFADPPVNPGVGGRPINRHHDKMLLRIDKPIGVIKHDMDCVSSRKTAADQTSAPCFVVFNDRATQQGRLDLVDEEQVLRRFKYRVNRVIQFAR